MVDESGIGNEALGRRSPLRVLVRTVGQFLIGTTSRVSLTVGLLVAAFRRSLWPPTWRRTVRRELTRQCWQVGVAGLPTTTVIALIAGVGLVFQAMYWLSVVSDIFKINQLIFGALVRELAPLMVAFIVIGRSITVMIVELVELQASGQIRMLDAQGIDTFDYVVVPRIVALAVSMFSLSVIFVTITLVSGYLAARAAGIVDVSLFEFLAEVADVLSLRDFVLFPMKTLTMGALIGAVTCVTVLASPRRRRDVSNVMPRGYMRAVLATLIVSGSLTVLVSA